MLRQLGPKIGLTVLVTLVLATTVYAGGWAATTLDELPRAVRAGEPITVGFVVRQHAIHPMSGLGPVVTATSGQHHLQVEATEDRAAHYAARLTFPAAGTWKWGIDAFGIINEMPPLEVGPRPTRFGQLLALPLTLLDELGLTPASPTVAAAPNAEHGRALFIAKGCQYCHTRSGVSNWVPGPVTGPDLTEYQGQPDFLRLWLRDPQAVRPETRMPNLDLSQAEIEALIAFLNAEAGAGDVARD
jgi:cytochrome c2